MFIGLDGLIIIGDVGEYIPAGDEGLKAGLLAPNMAGDVAPPKDGDEGEYPPAPDGDHEGDEAPNPGLAGDWPKGLNEPRPDPKPE